MAAIKLLFLNSYNKIGQTSDYIFNTRDVTNMDESGSRSSCTVDRILREVKRNLHQLTVMQL